MRFLSQSAVKLAIPLNGSVLVFLSAAALLCASCSSSPKVQKASTIAYHQGVPGGTLVETYKISVKVADVDAASRKVRLVAPDGSQNTFTALSGDRTFDQLKVGDQVQATVTRQLVIFLRNSGVALNSAPIIEAGLAPDIAASDVLKSDTVQRVAKVSAIDRKRRQATLDFLDGTTRRFKVRGDVDVQQVQPGDQVVIRTTSAVVLTLEKTSK